MKQCEQTKGMSVWEHGLSVKDYMFDLLNHLRTDTVSELKYEWKLPQFIYDNKDYLLDNIISDETLELYTKYHDCGKPFCLTIDSDGKRHFPNHSEVSYKIFKKVFPNNPDAAELIRRDMDFHLLKAKDVQAFADSKYAATLMLSGLSEIHSNCQMFGGPSSTSFKIKWKHMNKRGRQALNLIHLKNKTT